MPDILARNCRAAKEVIQTMRKINRIYARLFAGAWTLSLVMELGPSCIVAVFIVKV